MLKSHKRVLSVLKYANLSQEEISNITGYSKDGIRGRISELRKLGYKIQYIDGRYSLQSSYKNIYKWIQKHHPINQPVSIRVISDETNSNIDSVKSFFAVLIQNKKARQISNDKIILL